MDQQHAADLWRPGQQDRKLGQAHRFIRAGIDNAPGARHRRGAARAKRIGHGACHDQAGFGRQRGQREAVAQHGVCGHLGGTDSIGDDRQALAAPPRTKHRAGTGEGFSRAQQIGEAFDAQHATTAQHRLECSVRQPLGIAQPGAGPDRYHRAQPGGGTGGGNKAPRVADVADIEQDRPGIGVARQPVEHQAKADIRIAANPGDGGKANTVRLRPVQHHPAQRRRLRHQRQAARARQQMGARHIKPQLRHRHAERARTEGADAGRPRRLANPVGHAHHDGRAGAQLRQRPKHRRDGTG